MMIQNKGVCIAAQIYKKLHFFVADMKLLLSLEVYTYSTVLLQMEWEVFCWELYDLGKVS